MDGPRWPDSKSFAFSVFDDTDDSTLENVGQVYAFLQDRGFRTTKSVWPMRGPLDDGQSCEDPDYLAWIMGLKRSGFEIGLHNVASRSSPRELTLRGLDRFREIFGSDPAAMANHSACLENIYWGADRLTGVNEKVYNLLTLRRRRRRFRGHVEGDPFFWGDICRQRIRYVRNFVYPGINTLGYCPFMPYHDPIRPYVENWFASSNGGKVLDFVDCLSEKNQDRLEEEGGACIMYAHFSKGFQEGRGLQPRFKGLIERLSRKNGWFVPVSTLLDHLLQTNGRHVLSDQERGGLERRWLLWKCFKGTN